MNILVINLTRFGDLLQTQPVMTSLKTAGHRTGLVCLDAFVGAGALLGDVDDVFALPGAPLLAALDRNWPEALSLLRGWIADTLRGFSPDKVVNLTPTLAARLLTSALGVEDVHGFALDVYGFGRYTTPWAAFLQAASVHRGCSPFNLVDLFQRVAGLPPGRYCLRDPDAALSAELDAHPGSFIALQLGASQDYRRWPVASFVEAARIVWQKTGRHPVLLGTRNEELLALKFVRMADFPVVNLAGRTTLPVLAATLKGAELLLTNDTGTMHLAAGLGVPVMALFLATAQPWDTGPYLEGSISLEPDMACHPCTFGQSCPYGLACREHISARAVGMMLSAYLAEGVWRVPEESGARVWRASRDMHGLMDLASLSGHEFQAQTQWIRVQRQIYRQFLDHLPDVVGIPVQWTDSTFRESLARDLEQCMLLVTLLEEQARLIMLRPESPIHKKFLANCHNFQDLLARSPHLGVVHLLWQYQSSEESRTMDSFVALCVAYRKLLSALAQLV